MKSSETEPRRTKREPEVPERPSYPPSSIYQININDIAPNQDQPRKHFDPEALTELSDSIRVHGVIQPVIVTRQGLHYRLVAGERRWRAARMAGLVTIPAIVRELSDREVMQQALIENIQREDLNPIEEAKAYQRLINDYRLTQEQLAEVVGKSRSTVANSLRLNRLCGDVQEMVDDGILTAGHARAILALTDDALQTVFANYILDEGLSVRHSERAAKTFADRYHEAKRQAEEAAKAERAGEGREDDEASSPASAEESQRLYLESLLNRTIGLATTLTMDDGEGRVTIRYHSPEELEQLLEQLGAEY